MIITHDEGYDTPLSGDDVIVECLTLNFAMKDRNPMDFIRFFTKYDPNTSVFIPKEHISSFIPNHFKEIIIRVFVRDAELAHRVQVAFRKLLKTINSTLLAYSPESGSGQMHSEEKDNTCTKASSSILDDSKNNPFYVDNKKFTSPAGSTHSRSGFPSPKKLEPSAGLTLPKNFPEFLVDSPAKKRKR
jgi:hypothetical protein